MWLYTSCKPHKKCTAFKIRATWTHVPSGSYFFYHYFYYYDYYHHYYYYYCYYYYFFGLFGDTRRLLLQFTFLWTSAKGEWHSKSLNTAERCSKVKFSSGALLKQILGSAFLDVRLKSKSHVTSDLKYFNSVMNNGVKYS